MNILQIANNFGMSPIYYELFSRFDKRGIIQTIYVPLNHFGKNRPSKITFKLFTDGSKIVFSPVLKLIHIFLYNRKVHLLYRDLCGNVLSSTKPFDIVYASTWCLDGAIAYELYKTHGLPYVVCVRNTDINHYYKHFFYHRRYFKKILYNAQKVVFISKAYRDKTISLLQDDGVIKSKSLVINNGISDLYLSNLNIKHREIHNPIKVVYVGSILKLKNILRSCKAILLLRDREKLDITYTVIGKGYGGTNSLYCKKVVEFAKKNKWVSIQNSMKTPDLIHAIGNYDIFLMPSVVETFGLVYIEALSQGIPIIYSRGQGIDGTYPEGFVGFSVNSKSVSDIAMKIKKIITSYDLVSSNICHVEFGEYQWDNVANRYLDVYESII
jgi:L-malate glycosyltransferase